MSNIQERPEDPKVNQTIQESILHMLGCLLDNSERKCKYCKNVDVCVCLVKAVHVCKGMPQMSN